MWNYCNLSHIASKNGGPEKYIAKIRLHEHQQTVKALNKKWIRGSLPALMLLIPLAAKGGYDLIMEYKQKKFVSDEEAQNAEKKLLKYIECNSEEPKLEVYEANQEPHAQEEPPC